MLQRRLATVGIALSLGLLAWTACLAQEPQSKMDELWSKAATQIREGDRDGALATAKQAVAANADDPDAWWLLSWVHGQRGEYGESEAACREGT